MPFSSSLRNQALVDAARHCCVCHRYKGVKVEVHHIVPEAQGGSNELDNAITLCFDCHADAGHYNSKHPRGTKFSPDELRSHRDRWHEIVRQRSPRPPDEPDLFYCRYLLCKSFEAFREITLGEMSQIPIEQPFLISNEVRDFQRMIVESHPHVYRHDHVLGQAFETRESYGQIHPEIKLATRGDIPYYPYFEATRVPTIIELGDRVSPQDVVTRLLVCSGAPVEEISVALAYLEECTSGYFQEIYRTRPLWALYFAATNISGRPLALSGIEGRREALTATDYRPFDLGHVNQVISLLRLPEAPLPPNGTLLVPIATLLGPLTSINSRILAETLKDVPGGQTQIVSHEDLSVVGNATVSAIGPAIWPEALKLGHGTEIEQQTFHKIDLTNLYTIGRFWECGSCPHLFSISTNPQVVRYIGDLFSRQPGGLQEEHLIVPNDVVEIKIAELEAEHTWIECLHVNGTVRATDVHLEQGDAMAVRVDPGDMVEITGFYNTKHPTISLPWQRNCFIENFLIRERESCQVQQLDSNPRSIALASIAEPKN